MTVSSATRTKCAVKGCPGFVDFTTNGSGKHTERCECCERRKEWERQNAPKPPARPCQICRGLLLPPQLGKRSVRRLHSKAAGLASRVAVAKKKLADEQNAPNGTSRLAGSTR